MTISTWLIEKEIEEWNEFVTALNASARASVDAEEAIARSTVAYGRFDRAARTVGAKHPGWIIEHARDLERARRVHGRAAG